MAYGTVLRLTKLGDTSWIVHWCTAEFGWIKTVAKGARTPRSPFAGKLDLDRPVREYLPWLAFSAKSAAERITPALGAIEVENVRNQARAGAIAERVARPPRHLWTRCNTGFPNARTTV